jgi:TRAP-type C4-dicarboxylate transport system permease small subunit
MIVANRKTCSSLWPYVALVYVFVLLAFVFYEAEHRPTETASPEGPLVLQTFMSCP